MCLYGVHMVRVRYHKKFHRNLEYQENIGESSNIPKSWTFNTPILKLAECPQTIHNFKFK